MSAAAPGPRSAALQAYVGQRYPLFAGGVRGAVDADPEALEETLAHLFADDGALHAAVDGYAAFALDALRRERRFETEQTYPAKTFADTAREVYLDDAYMTREYLPGLLLSHHLWPHQRAQLAFFEQSFVPRVAAGSTVAEVGLGTGLYTRRLLQLRTGAHTIGYDISPAALTFATAHVDAFGLGDRFRPERRDVVADPPPPVAHLVCVEVLEHLDDPMTLLHALRGALEPGGHAFVTAALNAPNVDHIHLYRQDTEVAAQVVAAGFAIDDAFSADAYPPRSPGLSVPSLVAYVVH